MPKEQHPNSRQNLDKGRKQYQPSEERARTNGSKGGKESAKRKAIYKNARMLARHLATLPLPKEKTEQLRNQLGEAVDTKDLDRQTAVITGLMLRAELNHKDARLWFELCGDDLRPCDEDEQEQNRELLERIANTKVVIVDGTLPKTRGGKNGKPK